MKGQKMKTNVLLSKGQKRPKVAEYRAGKELSVDLRPSVPSSLYEAVGDVRGCPVWQANAQIMLVAMGIVRTEHTRGAAEMQCRRASKSEVAWAQRVRDIAIEELDNPGYWD